VTAPAADGEEEAKEPAPVKALVWFWIIDETYWTNLML
jgi:hypothetical protein